MSQPTTYVRAFNFTNQQAVTPSDPLPADKVDLEFNLVKTSLDETQANLVLIQRDDGAVRNASIGFDQLKAELNGFGFNPPEPWATETNYIARDTVFEDAGFYQCVTSHISGVFATDLAAGKWLLIADFTAATAEAAGYRDEAAASAAAAAASVVLTNADVVLTGADVDATAANVALTNADVALTGADVLLTHADVVLTGADVALTGANAALTDADAIATAADRVQTGLDRVQTGIDAAAAAASAATLRVTPQGRLTLSSTSPVPESDIVGAATIRYLPSSGVSVPIHDGAAFEGRSIGSGLSMDLTSNSGHAGYHQGARNFDLFAILDGSTVRLATGPSWNAGAVAGSDTVRGTGAGSTELELLDGFYVNKNAMTVRFGSASGNTVAVDARKATYLGTFRTDGDGLATDSKEKRWLDNAYNQALRFFRRFDPTASWVYSTASFRQANGSPDNQVSWVAGLSGKLCSITAHALASTSTASSRSSQTAIGLDSDTTPAVDANISYVQLVSGDFQGMTAQWVGCGGLGFHEAKWLERGASTDVQTWYGSGEPAYRNGMLGSALF